MIFLLTECFLRLVYPFPYTERFNSHLSDQFGHTHTAVLSNGHCLFLFLSFNKLFCLKKYLLKICFCLGTKPFLVKHAFCSLVSLCKYGLKNKHSFANMLQYHGVLVVRLDIVLDPILVTPFQC